MASTRYLRVDELPPRPDPVTGLPHPPPAPGFLGLEIESFREHDPALAPSPPPGQGPVLAWRKDSRRGSVKGAIFCTLLVAVLLCFTRGTAWLTDSRGAPIWALFAAFAVWIYVTSRRESFSAGAEWVAKRGHWVRLYELTTIRCHGYPWGAGMYLKDSAGRSVRLRFVDLSGDRLMWDLTYNGVLHSVIAGGAKTNGTLRRTLALPEPEPPPAPNNHPHSPA
jgi:hypothetical protein